MKRIHLMIFAAVWLTVLDAWSTNYYVSGTGSNSNNGLSPAAAFRDIQKAADLTKPGDTVLVMNGTYNNSCAVCDGINITKSGTAASYITYKAYPNHTPKIRFNGWQGVRIWGASYIEINGLEIEGNNSSITLSYAQSQAGNVNNPTTSGNGIYMDPNGTSFPHHIRIRNNSIYHCGGHGIGSRFTDYITIENNKIYNNAWYSPLGCSGISLYQNKNFDAVAGYRIFIRGNKIYNNLMNIPFFYNGKLEDGNGIIIDDAKNTQNGSPHGIYTGSVKIENNVVFDNGGRGIHAYLSNNVHVVNNTTYMNCKSPEVKDGELSGYGGDNLRFYNNVTYSRSDARANHNGDGASTNIVFDYNIYYNFNTSRPITKGPNDLVVDPKFVNPSVNPALANFKLQATSPAVNSGTTTLAPAIDIDKVARPQGLAYDRGAYEYVGGIVNQPPSVTLTSPLNNASFALGSSISLAANAADSDGSVAKVEFYQGTTKLGEDLTSPYSLSWPCSAVGTYTFTAKAIDNVGAGTTSTVATVKVIPVGNQAPTVTLTSPLNNASFALGSSINLAANAADSDGSVAKVEFYQGTTKLGEDLTSPYSLSWPCSALGTYTFTAKAIDNVGAGTTSTVATVKVVPVSNQAPTVTLTSPLNNASFTLGSSISLAANAADSDGSVAKVEFYQGTTKLGEDLTSPYSLSWPCSAVGTYTFTAKAIDNVGAGSTSTVATVKVIPATTDNCINKLVPDASKWVVRNSWNDQSNGSKVSNTVDALQITHRAWGNSYLWVVESGTPLVVTAGKAYNVSFDFKDDANIKVSSVQVALISNVGTGGDPILLQPAVTAPVGYSSATYTNKSVSISTNANATVYLAFRLNWVGQPSAQVNDFIKNITVCEASAGARLNVSEAHESLSLYPNPAFEQVTVKHGSSYGESVQIELLNSAGNLLKTLKSTDAESTFDLDKDMASGLYFIKVKSASREQVYKFVKE